MSEDLEDYHFIGNENSYNPNLVIDDSSNLTKNMIKIDSKKDFQRLDEVPQCIYAWDYINCDDNIKKLETINNNKNNWQFDSTTNRFIDRKLINYRGCENSKILNTNGNDKEYKCENWYTLNENSSVYGENIQKKYSYLGNHNYFEIQMEILKDHGVF